MTQIMKEMEMTQMEMAKMKIKNAFLKVMEQPVLKETMK